MVYSKGFFTIIADEFTYDLSNLEYIRLWSFHLIRICFDFSYNEKSNEIIEFVSKIRDKKFVPGMNCIEIAEVPRSYASIGENNTITTHFFSDEGTIDRLFNIEYSPQFIDQQVIHSVIGLLDYAFNKCSSNAEELKLANEIVAYTMGALATTSGMAPFFPEARNDVNMLTWIPEQSFLRSLKACDIDTSSILLYTVSSTALSNPVSSMTTSTIISSEPKGGCYIATSVYGSYDAPNVIVLRRFRDNFLLKRKWGHIFVKYYYKYSPKIVLALDGHFFINALIKKILDVFVLCVLRRRKGYR